MLCVPKLYVPLQTCMLRVVNNDTGEEVPRVFQKVAPYVYKRNKVRVKKQSKWKDSCSLYKSSVVASV